MQIGFIGLGLLGTPLAINLVESGNRVFVYNRTASKTEPLKLKGATVCASVAELASQCDIIFTIVSDDHALRSVTEGKDGMIHHGKKGLLHISMSTILPKTATELAAEHKKHDQAYLASPVFGRPEAASARKVNFVISGDESARKTAEPLLKHAGAVGVWDFGEKIEAANTVKLCGNFLIGAALEAIGESTALAKKSGVDPVQMWAMFNQTILNAPVYHNYSNIILHQKFIPAAFTMQLGHKDMNLVLQQADEAGQVMPLAELLKTHMSELIHDGKADIDWSAVSLAVGLDEDKVF